MTKNSKHAGHTPGWWWVTRAEEGDYYISCKAWEKFALVYCNEDAEFNNQTKYNAHLIAAAPMMKDALEMLCDFAEHASTQDYNEDKVLSWIAVVTAKARAALAAAGGGE